MSAILSYAIHRKIATEALKRSPGAGPPPVGKHSGRRKLWKRLSLLVAFPAIGLCMLNTYIKRKDEQYDPRPEFIKYDYMYRREKRFPWGDGNKSFFHNPRTNALPDGYEH